MSASMGHGVSRRRFLWGLGMSVTAVACTNGTTITTFGSTTTTSPTTTTPPPGTLGARNGRTLVIVELGGGNDGLNTVVPHADPAYRALRPDLGIDDPLDLDGEIGLHPSLARLAERYEKGQMAIVEGVGVPNPSLSHFESMDRWWTADGGAEGSGWLGRWLDGTVGFEDPTAAVSIGPGPSRALLGTGSYSVAIQGADGLTPDVPGWIDDADELMASWRGFVPALQGDVGPVAEVRTAIEATLEAKEDLGVLLGDETGRPGRPLPGFADQLEVAATLATSSAPPSILFVHGAGDFDTHQRQDTRHAELLGEVDGAIGDFLDTIEAAGRLDDVTLMTTSEFGRRAGENGDGTDHGTAAPNLLLGGGVAGGRHGQSPSLTALDSSGNLRHTVDFRSVYASVLSQWLEADDEEILGGSWEQLGLFA
ncbi:MAG: DUF1501 domain-containing protein [Acidimicrobiia bacterium]|nr:DUF1501 domain-containing protein [Acidimicrobiia bacterium]